MAESTELVQLPKEAIQRLIERGVDPDSVAYALDIPKEQVLSVKRVVHSLAPEDEEIATSLRKLTRIALEEVNDILLYGSFAQKQAIIKTVISSTVRLIGVSGSDSIEEGKVAIERVFQGMRDVGNANAATPTPIARTDDPD